MFNIPIIHQTKIFRSLLCPFAFSHNNKNARCHASLPCRSKGWVHDVTDCHVLHWKVQQAQWGLEGLHEHLRSSENSSVRFSWPFELQVLGTWIVLYKIPSNLDQPQICMRTRLLVAVRHSNEMILGATHAKCALSCTSSCLIDDILEACKQREPTKMLRQFVCEKAVWHCNMHHITNSLSICLSSGLKWLQLNWGGDVQTGGQVSYLTSPALQQLSRHGHSGASHERHSRDLRIFC